MTTMIEEIMDQETTSEVVESEISEEQDVLDEETYFQDIDLILEHGITKEDVHKLKKSGINTIKAVQMTITKKLSRIKGFDSDKIDKIRDACCLVAADCAFMTATELAAQRKQIFKLSTGSNCLDTLLGGGIEAMSITEVFGEFGTGKTQICHTLCVTAQMAGRNGYMGGKVFYIDTEHTFRPERLRTIADRFHLDHVRVLDNVLCARAFTSEQQYRLLDAVAVRLHAEPDVFKLVIVDSVMALFRVDFAGRGEMAERQQKLGQMLSRLQKISEEFNVAVFITNQITSDFASNKENVVVPIGGNILAHASTTRVLLTKGENSLRIAKIFDSPELEEADTEFYITNGGIADSTEENRT